MSTPEEGSEGGSGDIREDVVKKLVDGFHKNESSDNIGAFLGVEFQHDPPTDAERAEAHRRFVDELAERGPAHVDDDQP